jgi:hypothetical protein
MWCQFAVDISVNVYLNLGHGVDPVPANRTLTIPSLLEMKAILQSNVLPIMGIP